MRSPSAEAAGCYAVHSGSVRAYKFLDAQGRSPYTGVSWPSPGVWVEAATVRQCRDGVHGCAPDDLSWWLAAQLWEIELDGDVVVARHKVVARRGRLVRRIDEYAAAVRALGELSAWRCRDLAVPALRRAGHDQLAEQFARCSTIGALAALRRTSFDAVDQTSMAGPAATLAADAAFFVDRGEPAEAPFVACCAAGHSAVGADGGRAEYDTAYAGERTFQSAWLTERLALV
jgi:hypothetical protein